MTNTFWSFLFTLKKNRNNLSDVMYGILGAVKPFNAILKTQLRSRKVVMLFIMSVALLHL